MIDAELALLMGGKLDKEHPYYEHVEITPEELTCFKCKDNQTCPYAWDDYNTNGDCLASK